MRNNITPMLSRFDLIFKILFTAALFLLPIILFNGGPFRPEVIPQIISLTGAVSFLYIIGLAVLCALKLDSPITNNPIVKIGLGQLAAVLLIYLHSFIFNIGIPVKIYTFELFLLLLLSIWYLLMEKTSSFESIKKDLSVLPLIIASVVIIVNRELPREIMLSSDPDQHYFFAHQILKLGRIPLTQDYWGNSSFGYPSGLAAIAIVWSSLGFISIGDSITVQPLLQSILAIFTVSLAYRPAAAKLRMEGVQLTLALVTIFFWGLMPMPLLQGHYHLEGVGRLSSIFVLAITPLLIAVAWKGKNTIITFTLAALLLVLCAYLNPINIFIPGTLFALSLLPRAIKFPTLFFIPVIFLIFIFFEPYYYDIMTGAGTGPNIQKQSTAAPIEFGSHWQQSTMLFINNPWELLVPLRGTFLYKDLFYYSLPAMVLTAINFRSSLIVWGFPFFLLLAELIFRPIFMAIRDKPKFYLLEPYLQGSLYQYFYLWFFACLGIVFFIVTSKSKPALYAIAALLFFFAQDLVNLRDESSMVKTTPRYNYCGAMGCVTDDDRIVLSKIESQFKKYKSDGRPLSYREVPKILTANSFSDEGIEKWIIPWGASRIVPSYDTFPFAFYYFQGSSEYTLENYKRQICGFDIEWLKRRNIRFLFIPTEQTDSCAVRIAAKADPEDIIYQSGKSVFLRLF